MLRTPATARAGLAAGLWCNWQALARARTLPLVRQLRGHCFALGLAAAHLGCAGSSECPNDLPDDSDCASAAPSYSQQVGVVLEQYCEVCHLPGNGVSTHVFSNYDEIFATRRTMLTQIYGCRMPIGPRRLNSEDRALLLKWFVCGAPNN